MTQLEIESSEINGARKILSLLKDEWSFSITPSVKMKCRSKVCNAESYYYFPMPTKYRKLAGEAMVRFLLESKDNVRKFMYEQCELIATYELDNKEKCKRINIITNQQY